jgi:hypothetical protein
MVVAAVGGGGSSPGRPTAFATGCLVLVDVSMINLFYMSARHLTLV